MRRYVRTHCATSTWYLSALASPSLDVIDCLNLIIGQWAREQNQIATIGRHRFFRESDDPESHFETDPPESVSVVRGFFQSVRPAEDELLLNTNATIAVFRPAGKVKDIYNALTRTRGGSAAELTAALINLHEVMAKARVSYESGFK